MYIIKNFVSDGIKKHGKLLYRKFRNIELKNTKTHIDKVGLIEDLTALGLKKNDSLIVHGSLKSIGYINGGAQTLINSILQVIGDGGTLCVPTLSLSGSMLETLQNQSKIFDPKEKNFSFAISKALMNHPEAKRSIHPTHSIGAVGKYADWIVQDHEKAGSNFGEGTPWYKLSEINGKILGIGIPFGPVTYVHVIEDLLSGFPKQIYFKTSFSAKYKGNDGLIKEMTVKAHDPKCAKTRIDKPDSQWIREFFKEFLKKYFGLVEGKIGEAFSWYIKCENLISAQKYLLRKGITIYTTEDEFKHLKPTFEDLVKK